MFYTWENESVMCSTVNSVHTEPTALKYMYAHCYRTYTLHPHFHTCRTHINHACRQSARHKLISISIKTKLRIKYRVSKTGHAVMIETKASKYMYAHCTYTLQPHSPTCRTHINHVASQRDMNLSVLASRRS